MAHFVFNLEHVLRARRHAEQERQRLLADEQAVMTKLEARLRELDGNVQANMDDLRDNRLVGSLNEAHLYSELVRDPQVKREPVESIMQPAFPFVDVSTPVSLLATMITPATPAVLVRDFKTDKTFIITRSDILRAL